MALNVTQGGETVPLSVLSQRSGVSIATIKYYIREGLIRSNQDPEADDAETVEKVERFLEKLDDNDDVQEFFHNGILPEDEEE